MIPCSDYPPTENGEIVSHTRETTDSVSHDRGAGETPSSLVDELTLNGWRYGCIAGVWHGWDGALERWRFVPLPTPEQDMLAEVFSLRSRLTALETELREYRTKEAAIQAEVDAARRRSAELGLWCIDASEPPRSSPRTTEPL